MKFLKIEDNKAYFLNSSETWTAIDEIGKDDLLILVDRAIEGDLEMDDIADNELQNQAHRIIYENVHDRLEELLADSERFVDESRELYKDALEKYAQE